MKWSKGQSRITDLEEITFQAWGKVAFQKTAPNHRDPGIFMQWTVMEDEESNNTHCEREIL